jgi:mono/diheme cytochrome c family protein
VTRPNTIVAMLLSVMPVAAAAQADPAQDTQADPAQGKKIYDQMCAGCHGYRGDGGEGHRGGFSPHIGTLANKAYMEGVPDDYLVMIIKKGGAYMGKMATMPAWEKRLTDDEIRSIVAHIRTF